MADIYATMNEQPKEVQERVVEAMRLRADEPEMQTMLERYLASIDVSQGARALEIGCGAGAATRKLAGLPGVSEVTAIDPSEIFLVSARKALSDLPTVKFYQGDARSLAFEDEKFDLVLSHTVLCHIPDVERAVREAFRVLAPGGQLVVFDGDYATMNVAVNDFDPLQCCVDALIRNYVHDPWFMRHLPKLVERCGFTVRKSDGHGYVKLTDPQYLTTAVNRGADQIASQGTIGPELAAALKAELNRRINDGQFYGVIVFGSLIAQKPR